MTLLNRYALAFAIAVALCAAGGAQAQTPAPDANILWTTVGSAGTVDEADTQKVIFNRAMVQIGRPRDAIATGGAATTTTAKPAATAEATTGTPVKTQIKSAVVRYSIDGLFPSRQEPPISVGRQLTVRFLDTGASARVLVKLMLIEVDLASGSESTAMTFDSNSPDFKPADNYQRADLRQCERSFDFVHKAYYIEATLTELAAHSSSASPRESK